MRNTAHLEDALGIEADGIIVLRSGQLLEHGRNLRAEECRNDGRRRLVGTQTVGVRGAHDRSLEQAVVFVDGRYGIDQEGDELQVLRSALAHTEEVHARIGTQRPVVVLARAVDPLEGLLVQQHPELMAAGDLVHDRHQQLVVVVGQVGLLVDRSQLELIGRHLVMSRLDGNAQFQALVLEILHEGHHTGRYGPEIVILELLVLGRLVPHQRAAGQHQVGAHGPQALVHEEILLLPTQIGEDLLHVLVEVVAHLRGSLVHGGQRAQQRHLVVERLTRIGDEDGGDTERRIDDEGRRSGIPGRIAARLERIADTAVGERRGVGLLLHEQLARKLLEHPAAAIRLGKGIVLLGRTARQRLEPVGIVVGSVLEGPLPHAGGDAVGHLARQRRAVLHRVEQRRIGLLVEVFAHGFATEDLLPEIVRRTPLGSLHFDGRVVDRRIDHLESE